MIVSDWIIFKILAFFFKMCLTSNYNILKILYISKNPHHSKIRIKANTLIFAVYSRQASCRLGQKDVTQFNCPFFTKFD